MTDFFRIEIEGDELLARDLETFGSELGKRLGRASTKAGKHLIKSARQLVRDEDAIGATRNYLNGWRIEAGGSEANVLGRLVNTIDPVVMATLEHGRRPGARMAPKGALLDWMAYRGIPAEKEFVIRLYQSMRGTEGLHILDRLMEEEGAVVLEMLEEAVINLLEHMQ